MITQISYVIISGCDHTDLLCNFPCLCVLYKKMFYQYVSVIFLASHFFMYIFILSTGLKKKFFFDIIKFLMTILSQKGVYFAHVNIIRKVLQWIEFGVELFGVKYVLQYFLQRNALRLC